MKEYKTKLQKRKFYKSKQWSGVNGLREQAIRRDNYECQECKRLGKVYTDKHDPDKHKRLDVDHIKEIYTYPELALELDNLETLCIRCHNKKHNRFRFKKNKWDDERW
ncbi:5-methylcytosine-specific restriction endonuclease McrA [Metabacillus crassostreae]|uniref:HNH endonuclease n=1 Tax=Metabacillus crassostreae TaxID=929098 RepID=UPI00195614BB|nr:HNH endonuclease signature motif containing protein [Metabacillus crassostreae]MBM7605996.1 5-methylcytosine-specific restriction endonuclease McrA [Metabacillus crassostreae]